MNRIKYIWGILIRSGNFLDRRALGRMDESPDRREGAVVRLDYDRCQRHDA